MSPKEPKNDTNLSQIATNRFEKNNNNMSSSSARDRRKSLESADQESRENLIHKLHDNLEMAELRKLHFMEKRSKEMSCIDDQIENAHSRKEAIDAEKEKSRLKSLNNLTESLREADKRRAKHLNEIAHPPKTKF